MITDDQDQVQQPGGSDVVADEPGADQSQPAGDGSSTGEQQQPE